MILQLFCAFLVSFFDALLFWKLCRNSSVLQLSVVLYITFSVKKYEFIEMADLKQLIVTLLFLVYVPAV